MRAYGSGGGVSLRDLGARSRRVRLKTPWRFSNRRERVPVATGKSGWIRARFARCSWSLRDNPPPEPHVSRVVPTLYCQVHMTRARPREARGPTTRPVPRDFARGLASTVQALEVFESH